MNTQTTLRQRNFTAVFYSQQRTARALLARQASGVYILCRVCWTLLLLILSGMQVFAQNPLAKITVDAANPRYPLRLQIVTNAGQDIRFIKIQPVAPTKILSFSADIAKVSAYPIAELGMGVWMLDSTTLPEGKSLAHFMTDNATRQQSFVIAFCDAASQVLFQQSIEISINPAVILAAPCERKSIDLRTGIDANATALQPGDRDPYWNISCESSPVPAYVVDPFWANVQNEAWLSVNSSSGADVGEYSFCRSFCASTSCQVNFDLYISADDTVSSVIFNGVSYPVHELYTWSICHFSFTAMANTGTNLLQFSVTNMGGPTSLILWERSQVSVVSAEAFLGMGGSEGCCCAGLGSLDAGNDRSICQGESIDLFVATAQQGVVYEWRKEQEQSIVGSGEKIRVSPDQSTRYIVHATRNNCEEWDTVDVRVNPLPQFALQDAKICKGESKELSIINYQPLHRYEWRDERGRLIGNGETIAVSPVENTVYNVVATSPEGCTSQHSLRVDVERFHIVLSVSDSVDAEANTNMEIVVYAQAEKDIVVKNLSYTLHCTGGIFWSDEANYHNDEASISQTTSSLTIGKVQQEIARIKGMALVSLNRVGTIYVSNIITELDTNCYEITPVQGKLHSTPVCANDQRTIGIGKKLLLLLPNPAHGEVQVQSDYVIEEVEVFNSIGEKLYATSVPATTNNHRFTVEASGLYLVRAKVQGTWMTRSLIVQN